MSDVPVSDAEKERLLAEIGVEPSSIMIRRAPSTPAAPPPLPEPPPEPVVAALIPAPVPALPPPAPVTRALPAPAVAPAPRAPSWIWERRRLIAAVAMLSAGSAWMAMWMASDRPAAAGLALLGIGAGAWVALRPKKY
ncbi:MAG TPA: hypothetical protein VF950_14780 [Planctomycetota bacterium]